MGVDCGCGTKRFKSTEFLSSAGILAGGSKSDCAKLGEVGTGELTICSDEMAAEISEDKSEWLNDELCKGEG